MKARLIFILILNIILILSIIPMINFTRGGFFTYNLEKVQSDYIKDLNCVWGLDGEYTNGKPECLSAPCKTYNIEGKECVREGMTGGFLDTSIYYVCKDYGRMAKSCVDYYESPEELQQQLASQEEQE